MPGDFWTATSAAEAAGFIEPPPIEIDLTGARLGAYRLEEAIGRGGMGVVYRARREGDVEHEVAVKLIGRFAVGLRSSSSAPSGRSWPGSSTRTSRAVIDGGTTDEGQPYLVMELRRGPAHHRVLRPRTGWHVCARLELFRAVCAAVQYAHQNLVVHRDLKPGNILVTRRGRAEAAGLRHREAARAARRTRRVAHGDAAAPDDAGVREPRAGARRADDRPRATCTRWASCSTSC